MRDAPDNSRRPGTSHERTAVNEPRHEVSPAPEPVEPATGRDVSLPPDIFHPAASLDPRTTCARIARAALASGTTAVIYELGESGPARRIASASRSGEARLDERDTRVDPAALRAWISTDPPSAWTGSDAGPAPWDSGVMGEFATAAVFRLTSGRTGDVASVGARPAQAAQGDPPRGSTFALAIWADSAAADLLREGSHLARLVQPAIELASRHAATAAAFQEQVRLLAQLHHETGNTITAVRLAAGLLDGLEAVSPSSGRGEFISSIHAALDDMEARLDDIGVLRRAAGAPRIRQGTRLAASTLLDRVAGRVEPVLRTRGLRIVMDPEPDCHVLVDPEPIVRVIARLVLHAAGHATEGGTIRVSVRREGRGATITVTDGRVSSQPPELLADAFGVQWPSRPTPDLTLALVLANRGGVEVWSEGGQGAGSILSLRLSSTV